MLAEKLEEIDYNYIILYEPIKNSIIQYSNFYKIIYSNDLITYNGLYIIFSLENSYLNKDKCYFNIHNNNNNNIINMIIDLENYILNLFDNSKNKIYKLKEIINSGFIKYNFNDNIEEYFTFQNYDLLNQDTIYNFILKISGIWETKLNIGITFKIILINKSISL